MSPYAFATAGFSYFSTQSSFNDPYYYAHVDTRHFGDLVFASRFGGGLRIRLAGSRQPNGREIVGGGR